jgi:heat-inducible transcriptional repressor
MLSTRTGTILKSVVGQYITRATPVPSQSIVNDYELRVSPATVRNEMAYLEQGGYITRPHPSAGGIPLDKGYRYYVESLGNIKLPPAEQHLVSHLFHQVERELEEWLRLAATLIAQLAQNVAIVTMPKPADCRFKHMELVALRDSLGLLVLVLHGAKVKQQLITFEKSMSQPRLTVIANKLNEAYSGLSQQQILAKDIELSSTEQQLTDCLLKMMEAEGEQEHGEPYLDGLHFMLGQPEFAQSRRALTLMELVEHRNLLRIIAPQGLTGHRVRVVIGGENEAEVIRDYSVVITRYGLADEAVGTIGVVGPTRMPYARTISTVDYLSSVMSKLVAELYGKEPPSD